MTKDDSISLDRFHDVIVPPPLSWSPTVGWWIVIAVAALVSAAILLKMFIRWQSDRYRREALVILGKSDPVMIPQLLKQVAVTAWPRERTAGLTGDGWLDFLDRSGGMRSFRSGPGAMLEAAAYDPAVKVESGVLRELAEEWIRKHRRELAP